MDRRYDSVGFVASRIGEIAEEMGEMANEWAKAAEAFEDADATFQMEMAKARLLADGSVQTRQDKALDKNIQLYVQVRKCEATLEKCKAKFKVLDREGSLLQSLLSKERDEIRFAGYGQ